MTCYIILALVVSGLFVGLRKVAGGKIMGSDMFGQGEYYLGMPAGVIRFGCILLVALAVLNARYFTPAEIKARESYQKEVYGCEFFPGLNAMQQDVFQKSFLGPYIQKYMSFVLIKPTKPESRALTRAKDVAMP